MRTTKRYLLLLPRTEMTTIINFSGKNAIVVVAFVWMFTLHLCVLSEAQEYGDKCNTADPSSCLSPNLTCSDDLTCTCSRSYFTDDNNPNYIVCTKKSNYGEVCTAGNFESCIDTDTICIPDVNNINRCLCGINFYRNADDTCRSVNELGVYKLSATSTTSAVTLTWVTDRHGLDVTYTVKSNQGQGYLDGSVTETGATWSNLTAGRKYSFNITTTIPPDRYYQEKRVDVYKGDVWTEPAKPGQVLSVTLVSGEPGSVYLYDVTFQGSQGDVSRYSVSVNNEKMNTTTTTCRFYTLTPGYNCTYLIVAYNANDNPSDASVGNFRIDVADTGDIRQLTVTQDDNIAQELIISFLCPDEKALAGNIQGYRIKKILLNSAGQQEEETSYPLLASLTSCRSSYSAGQVGGITVERNYTFSVRAWNEVNVGNYTPPAHLYVMPKFPRLSEIYELSRLLNKVNSDKQDKTQIDVLLCVPCLLDATQGTVLDVGIIVCVSDGSNVCTDTEHLDDYHTWDYARRYDFSVPYRTTPSDWMQTLTSQQSELTYTIGQDATCTTVATTTYCNGPLPAEKDITLLLIQCNEAGCGKVQYSGIFSTRVAPVTQDNLTLGLGLGLGLGCPLVVACVVLGVLIYRRRRRTSGNYDHTDPNMTEEHNYESLKGKTTTNPPPHNRVVNKPTANYIDPSPVVPDYFTSPELGGSIHVYAGAHDDIYDYIHEDYITPDGEPVETTAPDSYVGQNFDSSLAQRDRGSEVILSY